MTLRPALRRAAIALPVAGDGQRAFAAGLQELLSPLPGALPGATPVLELRTTDGTTVPRLEFDDDSTLSLEPGSILAEHAGHETGGITHALIARATLAPCVPLARIAASLCGALLRLNHVGLGIPGSRRAQAGWDGLAERLGASGWLYRLETGSAEEILFLLPATAEEYASGQLTPGLPEPGPMLELYCGDATPGCTLHLNFETRLTRSELLRRFPGSAVFKPGDEPYFLSVCAASPWPGLTIFFDLSYADEGTVLTRRPLIMNIGQRVH